MATFLLYHGESSVTAVCLCVWVCERDRDREREREMSKGRSWLRHGYNKVARMLWKQNPSNENFPILEGHFAGQQHAQESIQTYETVKDNIKKLIKEFRIYRWNPDNPNNKPFLQSFYIDLSTCGPTVCLIFSSYLDSSVKELKTLCCACRFWMHCRR